MIDGMRKDFSQRIYTLNKPLPDTLASTLRTLFPLTSEELEERRKIPCEGTCTAR